MEAWRAIRRGLRLPNLSADALYGLRRDAEGVPSTKPAYLREPMPGDVLGMFHLLLVSAGATVKPGGYQLGGQQIRVINGANTLLSTLQEVFADEPPAVSSADVVVGVGAMDLPYPGSVILDGHARSRDTRSVRREMDGSSVGSNAPGYLIWTYTRKLRSSFEKQTTKRGTGRMVAAR